MFEIAACLSAPSVIDEGSLNCRVFAVVAVFAGAGDGVAGALPDAGADAGAGAGADGVWAATGAGVEGAFEATGAALGCHGIR